ncbi:MAG: ZIP family metal transporter [Deltaproteobacteria bacterium]|nr:ZIP family metal transporter [Deltaproteobacteria bacterium]
MTFIQPLFFYFTLMSAAVLAGGILPVFRHWHPSRLPLALSLSAGLMLGSSFIHLIPEAFELIGAKASTFVLLGLFFLYFFEKYITVHICETDSCEVHKPLGISAVIGLFLHSLTDGFALGVGLLVPKLGIVVFAAIFFHKTMEAFSLSSILIHAAHSKSNIILANLLLLAAIPLGALLSYYFVGFNNPNLGGAALAFSAGTFLHISLSDLLPEVHRYSTLKNQAFICFMLGLVAMFVLGRFLH